MGVRGHYTPDYPGMLPGLNETSAKPSAQDQTQKNRSIGAKGKSVGGSWALGSGVWAPARKGHSWGPLPVNWAPSPCPAHLVVVLLHEAAQRQAKALVRTHAPVHGVDGPGRLILIDLLPFAVQGHGCGGGRSAGRVGSGMRRTGRASGEEPGLGP